MTTAKNARMPTTTKTMRLWTRATNDEPAMFSRVIATTSATANSFAEVGSSLLNAALA